jgi:tetratricopeptide (TPR) repeat protein
MKKVKTLSEAFRNWQQSKSRWIIIFACLLLTVLNLNAAICPRCGGTGVIPGPVLNGIQSYYGCPNCGGSGGGGSPGVKGSGTVPDGAGGGGSPGSGGYSSDPRVQAAGQIGNAVGNAIGQQIGKFFFGDPQAEQAARVATWNAGLVLNNQGIAYANQGQWKAAYDCFRAAAEKCPGDANIEGNYEKAREELKREAREAKAKKDQETYDRLSKLLKQSGSSGSLGLKDLKMGDSNDEGGGGTVGIKGLPGIYLNDDTGKGSSKPYGIPGLPGTYVNGPGEGSGITQPGEKKLPQMPGDENAPNPATPDNPRTGTPNEKNANGSGIPGLPGIYVNGPSASGATQPRETELPLKLGDDSTPSGQANNAAIEPNPPAGTSTQIGPAPSSLQQQANASQAAASAKNLEDASAQARAGFDSALPGNNMAPVQLGSGSHNGVTAVSSTPEVARADAVPVGVHNFNFPSAPQPTKAAPAATAAPATTTASAETAASNRPPLTREQQQAWIKHLTNEISGMQILLRRLDKTEMNNQQDRTNWVDELNQATDRAWEHLGNLYMSQGLDGLSDRMEKMSKIQGITPDELNQLNRMQKEIQAATHTYAALQVTETLADEGKTREKVLQNLHTTISDILSTPAVQKALKIHKGYADFFSAAKDYVDSMYDLRDVTESARQLAIQNNASSEYLNRVNEMKSHMETVVKELQRARSTLANMDASAGTQ